MRTPLFFFPHVFFFRSTITGDRIASFFLDAYSRPAEKRGGAWMAECLGTIVVSLVMDILVKPTGVYSLFNQTLYHAAFVITSANG